MSTEKERKDIARALARWFESQEVDSTMAAFVMVTLAGTVTGLAAKGPAHLDRLMKLLVKELHRAGCESHDRFVKRQWGDPDD